MDHSQLSSINHSFLVRETQIYSRERNTKRCSSSSSVHHSTLIRTPNDENPLRFHQNPNPKTSQFSFSSTMEEDSSNHHQSSSMASLHNNNNNSSSSSTIRFLSLLKQPDLDPNPNNPFELDESDVIWSSSCDDDDLFDSPTVMTTNSSPSSLNRNSFRHEKFGLSAALLSDTNQLPFIQRKRALNPSFSATSAARTIPPVVVPIPRSGSSSDDYYSSSSGNKFHQSAPVNVPVWPKASNGGVVVENMGFFDEEDDGDEEMLPPHEIVARSHVTTFSVFEGVGRTLKGRDLRRVRNGIWQKTGFLD